MSLTTACTTESSQIDSIDFYHSHYIRLTQQTLTESIVYVANLACYANSKFIENDQLTMVLHTSNYRQILQIFNVTTLSLLPWWVYVQIEKWLTSRAVTQHHLHTVRRLSMVTSTTPEVASAEAATEDRLCLQRHFFIRYVLYFLILEKYFIPFQT